MSVPRFRDHALLDLGLLRLMHCQGVILVLAFGTRITPPKVSVTEPEGLFGVRKSSDFWRFRLPADLGVTQPLALGGVVSDALDLYSPTSPLRFW